MLRFLVALAIVAGNLNAQIINVPADQPTIQAGIDAAAEGDTVLVQAGTYYERLVISGKNIILLGVSGPDSTIIDANNFGTALTINNNDTSLVAGLKLTHGFTSGAATESGGLIIHSSWPTIQNCVITENQGHQGGGLYIDGGTFESCKITNNEAEYEGGGVFLYNIGFGEFPSFTNCQITGNICDRGASIYGWANLINSTVADNAGEYGWHSAGTSIVKNSIIWNNGNQSTIGSFTANVTYSLVEGGYPGSGNIYNNPLFVDSKNEDYLITDYSPAIGAGTPTGVPNSDINGNPRPNPEVSNPDMGAYESSLAEPIEQIVAVSPSQNALNVPLDAVISVTFDLDINPATIDANTFVVHGSYTGKLSGAYAYDGPSKTATFTPDNPFKVGEQVSISLTTAIGSAVGDTLVSPMLWDFIAEVLGGSGQFTDFTPQITRFGSRFVTTADLDGDTDIDMAVACWNSDSLTVLLNGGNGIFSSAHYHIGSRPSAAAIADFDADGDNDIVITNYDGNNVSILMNDGAGIFAQTSVYNVGTSPQFVKCSDLDGDGDSDIAVVNIGSANISILLNNGNGSFQNTVHYSVESNPREISIGDLDGDGAPDLAVINYGSTNISLLMNDGHGSFSSTLNHPIGSEHYSVAINDIDDDGDNDLAVSNYEGIVSVLMNSGGNVFSAPISQNTPSGGPNPTYLRFADVDGDGDSDLLMALDGTNSTQILVNDGSGTFASVGNYDVGGRPSSITVADLDGDGDLDFVTSIGTRNITVLYNHDISADIILSPDSLSFGPTKLTTPHDQSLTVYNQGVDSTLQVTSITSSNAVFTASPSTFSVLPGDSATITVTFTPTAMATYSDSLTISSNDPQNPTTKVYVSGVGDPIISISPTQNALNVPLDSPVTIEFYLEMDPASFDINTLIIQGEQTGRISGSYDYLSGSKTLTFTPITKVLVGDRITVTVTSGVKSSIGSSIVGGYSFSYSVEVLDGTGQFVPRGQEYIKNKAYYLLPADLNSDGKTDLVSMGHSYVNILLQTNDFTFSNTELSTNFGYLHWDGAIGDYDLDGDNDVAVLNTGSNNSDPGLHILTNDGNGTLTRSISFDLVYNHGYYGFASFDIENDGDDDFVITNADNHTLLLYRNDGYANFVLDTAMVNYSKAYSATPSDVISGDWNSDGFIDIAVANKQIDPAIYFNDGVGGFIFDHYVSIERNASWFTSGDWDSDGDLDLAVSHEAGNIISIVTNDGTGLFTKSDELPTVSSPRRITSADIDGDDDLDLMVSVYAEFVSEDALIFTNNGSGIFIKSVGMDLADWRWSIASGDFDNDGDMDLVFGGLSDDIQFYEHLNGSAKLTLSPSSIKFGEIQVGLSEAITLTITNDGVDSTLRVSSITSSDPAFVASPSQLIVEPQTSGVVTVVFSPTAMADYSGSVVILSNASEPEINVSITGFGSPIVSLIPRLNANQVSLASLVSISFSEEMDASSLNSETFIVRSKFSDRIAGTYEYYTGTDAMVFTPVSDYFPGDVITVTLTTGIRSALGVNLASSKTWQFTTESHGTGDFAVSDIVVSGDIWGQNSVTIAEWNGDGILDFAMFSQQDKISLMTSEGDAYGYYSPPQGINNSTSGTLVVGDINNDSIQDILFNGWDSIHRYNTNGGTVTALNSLPVQYQGYPRCLLIDDWDGDGDLDLLRILDNAEPRLMLNAGNGQFTDTDFDIEDPIGGNFAVSGDWNNDGFADIAMSNPEAGTISITLNNGDGTFTSGNSIVGLYNPQMMTSADFDNDRDIDLACITKVAPFSDVLILVYRNDGSGNFSLFASIPEDYGTSDLVSGDWNSDGYVDLASISGSDSMATIFSNINGSSFQVSSIIGVGSNCTNLAAGDINSDGAIDIFIVKNGDPQFIFLQNGVSFGVGGNLNIGAEASGTIEIGYRIINPALNLTSLNVEYSIDGGTIWQPPSLIGDITDIASSNYQGTVEWISDVDLPANDIEGVVLKITPYDADNTGRIYTSRPFHIDNNGEPSATLAPLSAPEYKDDIAIAYVLSDSEADVLSLTAEYSLDGGAWRAATVTGTTTGLTTYTGSLTWNSLVDLPIGVGTVEFRITPSDNDAGVSDTVTFFLDNIGAAVISITNIFDVEVSRNVDIDYQISDDESDLVSIFVEYTASTGATWIPATVTGDTSAIALTNYAGSLVWDSNADLPGIDNQAVRVRLTPYDAHIGFADMTDPFHLDNNDPPAISIQSLPDTLAIKADIGYAITDDEGDTVSIDISYSTDISTWNTANANAESIIINPDQYNGSFAWDVLSDVGFQQLIDVQLRFVVADNDSGDAVIESGVTILNYPADYTGDLVIDFDDLSIFVTQRNSEPQVLVYEIGPATGTVPDLTVNSDGVIDFEDLVVFAQMWNWSFDHNGFGKSMPTLAKAVTLAPSISLVQRVPENLYRWDGQIYLDMVLATDQPIMMVDGVISNGATSLITRQVEAGAYWDSQYDESFILSRTSPDSTQMVLAVVGFEPKANQAGEAGALLTMRVVPDNPSQIVQFAYNLRGTDGAVVESGLIAVAVDDFLPEQYVLHQNYPNPFNPSTTIRYELPEDSRVVLVVYDIMGREATRLIDESQVGGYHQVIWNGRDVGGREMASGIYFTRLLATPQAGVTPEYTKVRKMLLLK